MSELSFNDTFPILELIASDDARRVLIGGQALNLWCHEYGHAVADLQRDGVLTSRDVDFQGDTADAQWCARQLKGQCFVDNKSATPPSDIILFNDANGVEQKIDFLPVTYGLNARKVLESSIEVPFTRPSGGELKIRVMNPIHCLMSRAHNVIGLPDKYSNPHGIRQLKASLACARAYIERVAVEESGRCRTSLNAADAVFKFAVNDSIARRLFVGHGIEIFDAVPNTSCMPEVFRTTRYPQMRRELAKCR